MLRQNPTSLLYLAPDFDHATLSISYYLTSLSDLLHHPCACFLPHAMVQSFCGYYQLPSCILFNCVECILFSFRSFSCYRRNKVLEYIGLLISLQNIYGSLHGGAGGDVAVRVATACARTIVGKDKELFLGELSISYLSSAPENVSL